MIPILTTILLFIVSYVLWVVYKNRNFSTSKLNLPPGSYGWPFFGESLALLQAGRDGVPERFVQERIKKHGSPLVFKTSILGDRMAVFCGPAGNKFLFGNENKLVAAWWPISVRKIFGKCLITTRGNEAKWMRRMLLSYLGPDAFASHYAATMDVVTRSHIENHWRGKEEVNVYQTVRLYAFELACRLFLSLEELNHIAKLGSLFDVFLKGVIALPIDFPGTRFYCSKKAAVAIRTELMTLIKARRVAIQEGKASPTQDLLSHLLTSSDENGRYLTEWEIANNILLLLFAGHDTSTCSITLIMKRLGEHPNVYDKVLNEQLEICKTKEAGDMLKWEDIKKMKYTWNVVSEVMRLTTPVMGAFREALVDFEYAGYTIPKGWKLVGHEVSDESLKTMHRKSQEFFNMSAEEKKRYAQKPGSLEGYGQAFVISEDQKLEWCDMIFLKTIPTHIRKLEFWPQEQPHNFREALDTYSRDMRKTAVSIIGFIAMALGLDGKSFSEVFEGGNYDVRMNCYPPCPEPERVIGISSHADISGITLLTDCGDIPGLQVLKDGQWVFVEPITNAIVVNIGIIMEVVSNGIYKAPYHRAAVNKQKDRFSIVNFCYPSKEFYIKPAEELINSDSLALYKSFTYYEYFQSFYERTNLSDDGVPFIDTLKI